MPGPDVLRIEKTLNIIHRRSVSLAAELYAAQVKSWITDLQDIKSPKSKIKLTPLSREIRNLFELTAKINYFIGIDTAQEEIETLRALEQFAEINFAVWTGIDWERLGFQAALEKFLKKGIISPQEFKAAEAEIKAIAFSVQRIEDLQALPILKESLAAYLKNGGVLKNWIDELPSLFQDLGYTVKAPDLTPWHLETIFRTNQHSVFNAAKYEAYKTDNYVTGMTYITVGDNRVRLEHAELDGLTFAKNDPIWESIYPPNGYNCRCTTQPVSDYYMRSNNLQYSTLTADQAEAVSKVNPDFQGKLGIMGLNDRLEKYAAELAARQ